ncbi:uncharacterized protein [Epargyreus clarus]|uniref:uncharacterized protein n=1 Tax=Epargyreus clarus TaxID=520877 RepID=UPI003C2B5655
MALKLKYTDEHGILQIDMTPSSSPQEDITDPQFDSINTRFGQCDLFGGKYDYGGDTPRSLFRSRYNSIEEELANTPYAFATDRSLPVDITIESKYDDVDGLFGPQIDYENSVNTPAFTVTQLIHAQDRYFDLSSQKSSKNDNEPKRTVRSLASNFEVRSAPGSAKRVRVSRVPGSSDGEAFKVLSKDPAEACPVTPTAKLPVVPTPKKKKETSFAIIAEPPVSRPTSPKSLPVEIRPGRVSPFKGRGFREETSRHNTPKTSAANSRCSSPPRRRTSSLSRIDKMATATLPPPVHLNRPHSPRNFLKENIEEVRELSELNREKHEAEAEQRRREEEEALLKEMGLLDKKDSRSRVNSRANSRSNSPIKITIKSRSSSPSAVLYYENIPANSNDFVNPDDGPKPVPHRSRLRSMSKSQPQSNNGSPKHSKIPQRQNSVSPVRNSRYDMFTHRRPFETNLNKNQRFISNSTSSIHETIKIGSKVHDKRAISKSTQHLDISPTVIKSKPPISPGRGGPPPSNKSINAKRLSPIVGTPSKSPIEDAKSGAAKASSKPTPAPRKPAKTTGNTPAATSRLNSRTPSRAASRDSSPDKRKNATKTSPPKPLNNSSRPVSRVASSKTTQKPPTTTKSEVKKTINRTNSNKSLTRTPSTKALNEKPPMMKKRDSKKDLTEKARSTSNINEVGKSSTAKEEVKKDKEKEKDETKKELTNGDIAKDVDEITKQDNETQYDKATNENGELVILTKKNIVSMTTAAITSQPLEVVATVTNQLPTTFEKAREKGIFERLSSKESLLPKDDETDAIKEGTEEKEKVEKIEKEERKPPPKPPKSNSEKVFSDDSVKLKLLQPPYNNPQVERVKQKIDSILKEPEISTENILAATPKARQHIQNTAEEIKTDLNEIKNDEIINLTQIKDDTIKQSEEITAEIRSEASKIVDSIITPVEEPKEIVEKTRIEIKENIEPIVMVVNEKKTNSKTEIEKINEALVKGEPEVEVQSSNLSTPGVEKLKVPAKTDGDESDRSAQSNGGFPQSTSTTPKPPARAHRQPKEDKPSSAEPPPVQEALVPTEDQPKPNICQRLMGKCKTKCCTCCVKPPEEEQSKTEETVEEEGEKKSTWKNLNCCKKKEVDIEDVERAAGKGTTIEFESETKRKRKLRDILCSCCRRQRVSDIAEPPQQVEVSSPVMSSDVVKETGCCGKKREVERRDSILSDQAGNTCCNNRLCRWLRGACRRQSEQSSSRRTSLFSKNKSLSPTLPPEDTRKKLDPSLVEHTSVMRGAIPVLPIALAYFCLVCNVLVPGLGTIFSGMFCLCFGIPRFGVHDGAKHRIGSLVINLLVGCGQLFTVLFCLVGWGWSIWWGVIMVKISRKYRKLKAEAMADEAEAPPVTANNHTRA